MADEPSSSWRRLHVGWRSRTAAALLFGIVLVALVVLNYERANRERDAYDHLLRSNRWFASQLELELLRFLSTVDGFVFGVPDTNHEEVLFYFDLLWSIAPVLLNDPEAAGVRKIDGTMQTVGSLLADLRELEPVVKQLTPGDQASRRMIADRLKAYEEPLHNITIEVAIGDRRRELFDRLHALERRGMVLNAAILAGCLLLVLFLLFEIRESRREAERERKARDAAILANQAKSRFLANMSHELRTPLNVIIGFSELIRSEPLGPLGADGYRDYVNDILTSARRLLTIFNDVIDIACVDSGTMKLDEGDFDPCEEVRTGLRLLGAEAEGKQIELTTLLHEPAPIMRGDAQMFCQICFKLAGNGVKFSPIGSQVIVVCSVEDGQLHLVVEDNGPGIAPEELAKVVEPFHQPDAGLNRRYEGCGLGLPLAKAFVELHGGTLDIETRLGLGTRVTARFPKERILTQNANAA